MTTSTLDLALTTVIAAATVYVAITANKISKTIMGDVRVAVSKMVSA